MASRSGASARVAMLTRHFEVEASEQGEEQARGLEMCPTSAVDAGVFAGIPQAPEDPILGVSSVSSQRERAKTGVCIHVPSRLR